MILNPHFLSSSQWHVAKSLVIFVSIVLAVGAGLQAATEVPAPASFLWKKNAGCYEILRGSEWMLIDFDGCINSGRSIKTDDSKTSGLPIVNASFWTIFGPPPS